MKEEIILYQKLTHRAWAAKETINHNGWLVRLSEGVTNRVNSVLPLVYHGHGDNLESDINLVEKMYKENNLPLVFQIPDYVEPSNLVEFLENIGFESFSETAVMSREVNQEQDTLINDSFDYKFEKDASEHWFKTLQRINKIDNYRLEAIRKIISRTSNSKVTCSVNINNRTTGIVLGVIERPFMGIYDLLVDPDYRRKGIGEFIMKKMLLHAYESNLSTIYLQVEVKNLPAVKLYKKLNFQELFKYRYMKRKRE